MKEGPGSFKVRILAAVARWSPRCQVPVVRASAIPLNEAMIFATVATSAVLSVSDDLRVQEKFG